MRIQGGKLYKCMLRYVLEIFSVIFLLFVSYNAFTGANLSSYAQIAEASQKENMDLEILYGKKGNETYRVLSNGYLLSYGTLSIKNPNSHVVTAKTDIKIDADSLIDISLIDIEINGKIVPKERFFLSEGYYTASIEKREVEAQTMIEYDVKICGDALYVDTNRLSYHFEVTESFYN